MKFRFGVVAFFVLSSLPNALAIEATLPENLPPPEERTLVVPARALPPHLDSRGGLSVAPMTIIKRGQGFRYTKVTGEWRIGGAHPFTGPSGGTERFNRNVAVPGELLSRLCTVVELPGNREIFSAYNDNCDASKGGKNFIYNDSASNWAVYFFCNDRGNQYANNSGDLSVYLQVFTTAQTPPPPPPPRRPPTVPAVPTSNHKPTLRPVNRSRTFFEVSMPLASTFIDLLPKLGPLVS